ncbi:unnamed protein product [Ranitomeya imitator]|uniref:Magnesium transporter n=1 Tax=Ranitomeya imitator TaxID=111125 RepID=A0ABN9M5X6_9NEOB|nr:unnamed protein product [Ranitomeya imitator]
MDNDKPLHSASAEPSAHPPAGDKVCAPKKDKVPSRKCAAWRGDILRYCCRGRFLETELPLAIPELLVCGFQYPCCAVSGLQDFTCLSAVAASRKCPGSRSRTCRSKLKVLQGSWKLQVARLLEAPDKKVKSSSDSAILSSHFLNERLTFPAKIGCALSIFGSTIMVLHAPQEEEISTLGEMEQILKKPGFVAYASCAALLSLALALLAAPRWGHTNVLVYMMICSLVGSLTVASVKGLGVAVKGLFLGSAVFKDPLTWLLLLCLVICISVQIHFLNRALDVFTASLVTPIYYVLFTSSVLICSAILFEEWRHLNFGMCWEPSVALSPSSLVCACFMLIEISPCIYQHCRIIYGLRRSENEHVSNLVSPGGAVVVQGMSSLRARASAEII